MFTGLVEITAAVCEVREAPPGRRLRIAAPSLVAAVAIGESVCVSGCCLTVVAAGDGLLDFEAGPETLSRTTLGQLEPNDFVNLERSLTLGTPLGGHLVTGHIDCVGTVDERRDLGEWRELMFRFPATYAGQIAAKGSIAVDGVSLTVVAVERERFSVQLIPHTLAATTLGALRPGDTVNLETDLLAKYVERQLAFASHQKI